MTPQELKAARKALNLSCRELARELGFSHQYGDRSIRALESGERPIKRYIELAVRAMVEKAT